MTDWGATNPALSQCASIRLQYEECEYGIVSATMIFHLNQSDWHAFDDKMSMILHAQEATFIMRSNGVYGTA